MLEIAFKNEQARRNELTSLHALLGVSTGVAHTTTNTLMGDSF